MADRTATSRQALATDEADWTGPLIVRAEGDAPLHAWAASRRAWIEETLLSHGAILFKGFAIDARPAFQDVAAALCGELLDYVYRSTPRTSVGAKVYTATEYRASASIPFHNENSYQRSWPMRLVFCCVKPAAVGGETGLASTRRVTARIDPDVMRLFGEHGVMYVRNYRPGIDLTWQESFQTQRPEDVEAYCRRHAIEYEWVSADHLRTRQVCQGVGTHPVTGERLWFNQAHLFHISSLTDADRSALLDLFGEDGVPRHAYRGDGAPIDEQTLAHLGQAYEAEAFERPWDAGDVLLVDNMLVAHARSPYQGTREVLVAMGDSHTPAWPGTV
jgi:alpha-ketoglutarate-dependent taurine dioxygenase